jgi:uncharacterized membrane protein YtjA (UPF0391 family)
MQAMRRLRRRIKQSGAAYGLQKLKVREPWEYQIMGLLRWALIFFVVAVIAAVFGFSGIAAGAADIAKVLFFLFVALVVILLVLAATAFRALP